LFYNIKWKNRKRRHKIDESKYSENKKNKILNIIIKNFKWKKNKIETAFKKCKRFIDKSINELRSYKDDDEFS